MDRQEFDQGCINSECGNQRLRLMYLDIPSINGQFPPGSALDFGDLRWEVLQDGVWKIEHQFFEKDFAIILGDGACVSQLHSFDPALGRATMQFSTTGPTLSDGSVCCLYSWREWDLLNNREYRFIEIPDDIFSPPEDRFAAKCEKENQKLIKRMAEQDVDPNA